MGPPATRFNRPVSLRLLQRNRPARPDCLLNKLSRLLNIRAEPLPFAQRTGGRIRIRTGRASVLGIFHVARRMQPFAAATNSL